MARPQLAEWEWDDEFSSVCKVNRAKNKCDICNASRGEGRQGSLCLDCDHTIELFNHTDLRYMAATVIQQNAVLRCDPTKPLYTSELWDQLAQRHRQGTLGWSEYSGWPQLSLIRQVKCFIRQYNCKTWSNMDQVWRDYQAFVAQKEFWCQ